MKPLRHDVSFVPLAVAATGIGVFIGMDAVMKGLVAFYPVLMAVFLRYVAGTPIVWAVFLRRPQRLGARSIVANGARGALIVVVASSFFFAVTILPLADVIAVSFLAPFFIAILGRTMLKEPLPPRVLVGLGIGFIGVLVILHGQFIVAQRENAPLGFAAALLSAVTYALSNVLVRRQSMHDSVEAMVMLQTTAAAIVLIPFGIAFWQPVELSHIALFLACGVLGTGGQLMMAWALSHAPASRLAVLEYTSFLWAALFGWLAFDEIPTVSTIAGAAIIIGACLVALKPPGTSARGRASARGTIAAGRDPGAEAKATSEKTDGADR